jgi:predicted amidohydrolase YtcJ
MFVPHSRVAIAMLTVTLAAAPGCSRPPRLAADLLITRARVWTGSPAQPEVAAIAVIGDRIVDVGGADPIERWRGATTTVLDAEGRRVVPGFNDALVRFVDGGTHLDSVDLRDAATPAEFARRIGERSRAKPGEWIVGGQWDDRSWDPHGPPTRALIDDLTNSSPVFVVRYDGGMALANAAALGRAGITENTSAPSGGAIARDANGFPNGILTGAAMALVERVVPKTTLEQRVHAVKRALEVAESFGVTSVQDVAATYEDIAAYADLAGRGELTVRVYAIPAEGGWYDQAKLGVHRAFGSSWLRIGAVHAVLDRGDDADEQRTRLMAADHAGLQLSVEPAGDGQLAPVLDVLNGIAQANGGRDRRFRIDASRATQPDGVRIAALNAVAVLRPSAVPPRVLLDHAVRVALGSGWPDAPLNPMLTLRAAIDRQLTAAEALAAHTSGSAVAEFQESEKGTIARGKLADLVVLSDDILSIPAAQIGNVRALTTIVGGRIVHQRKP